MKVWRLFMLSALLAAVVAIAGCACQTGCEGQSYEDLKICIITSVPLKYFYGCTALVEVWGPDGFYDYKNVPLYMGSQIVIFRDVPIGPYTVTISYNGMVVTKCALLCGYTNAEWRQQCIEKTKDILKAKKGGEPWHPRDVPFGGDEDFLCPGSDQVPCVCSVCFTLPEDFFKYDP